MHLTVPEMELLCVFHKGTVSATLESLKKASEAKNEPPERMARIKNVITALEQAKNEGKPVAIAFDDE